MTITKAVTTLMITTFYLISTTEIITIITMITMMIIIIIIIILIMTMLRKQKN